MWNVNKGERSDFSFYIYLIEVDAVCNQFPFI